MKPIVDVTTVRPHFAGEYTGGMPIIGCPGYNGETMALRQARALVRPEGVIVHQ